MQNLSSSIYYSSKKSKLLNRISLSPKDWWIMNRLACRLNEFAWNFRAFYQFGEFSVLNSWLEKLHFLFSQFCYSWFLSLTSTKINRQDTLVNQVWILLHNSLSHFAIFLVYFFLLPHSSFFPMQFMDGTCLQSLSVFFLLNFLK
jgi:hypothetical protein